MYNGVSSNKRQSITLQTDEEGQCLSRPLPPIVKSSEDFLCGVVRWSEVHQWHEDAKESQYMEDEDDYFDSRQSPTDKHVDADT